MFAASLTFLGIVAAASGRAAEPLSLPIAASSARAGATTPATGVGGAAVQWSGSYIGLNYVMGGGAAALSDPVGLGLKGVGMTGPAYGGTIGYDYLFGRGVVAGVAADIDISRASGSYRSTETLSSGSLAPTASWALRGRIGASVGDASLVYGTAGYSRALETLDIESPNLTWRGTKSFSGAVVGGGVETQLMDELFLRAEYLHGFYASRSYLDGLLRVAPDSDEFRLGLIYRPDATAGNAQPPTIATSTPAWNGFYGVALAGSQNINTQIGSAATLLAQGLNSQGGAIAAVAGYGQIVDAEYLSAEAEAGASRAGGALSFDGNTVARLSYNSQYALRGRVGALLSPDTMVSAAAGWSWAGASASSGVLGPSSHVFFNGPQIGVGLDAMLSAQVGARLEYLQTFYGPQGSLSATPAAGLTRAGLLLHF